MPEDRGTVGCVALPRTLLLAPYARTFGYATFGVTEAVARFLMPRKTIDRHGANDAASRLLSWRYLQATDHPLLHTSESGR
jgi:hypothetical protein